MATSPVHIVVTATNQAGQTLKSINNSVVRLDRTFGTLIGRLKVGIQWHVAYGAIRQVEAAIRGVIHAIPDLLRRGAEWESVFGAIQDATGMAAEQASELAAVQMQLGNSTFRLSQGMLQFARNVEMHPHLMKELGAEIIVTNDGAVDAYRTFMSLRKAVAEMGASTFAASGATQLLGRGARDLLDLLLISPAAYREYAREAREMGLVLTEAGAAAIEQWGRTRAMLDATITGIGAQVLQGAAPALSALVTGIAQAIQDNLDRIAGFAAAVVGFVTGIVSGLFGISINIRATGAMFQNLSDGAKAAWTGTRKGADDAKDSIDAATEAIQRQIDAIDKMIQRLDRAEDRRQAREEYRNLMRDLAEARRELNAVRSKSVFAAAMSNTEAELARQALARETSNAQQKVRDAEKALAEWKRKRAVKARRQELLDRRAALQDQLSDMRQAYAKMNQVSSATINDIAAKWRKGGVAVNNVTKRVAEEMAAAMRQAVADGQKFGLEFADTIKDILFGDEQLVTVFGGSGSPQTFEIRSGGLVGAVKDLAGHIDGFVKSIPHIQALADAINFVIPPLVGALGVKKVIDSVPIPGGGPRGGGSNTGRLLTKIGPAILGATGVGGFIASAIGMTTASLIGSLGYGQDGKPMRYGPGVSSDHPAPPWAFKPHQKRRRPVYNFAQGTRAVGGKVTIAEDPRPQPGPAPGDSSKREFIIPGRMDNPFATPINRQGTGSQASLAKTMPWLWPQRSVLNPPESAGPQPGPAPTTFTTGAGFNPFASPTNWMKFVGPSNRRWFDGNSPIGSTLADQSSGVRETADGIVDIIANGLNASIPGRVSTSVDAFSPDKIGVGIQSVGVNRLPVGVENRADVRIDASNATVDTKSQGGRVNVDNEAGTWLGIWPTGGKTLPVNDQGDAEPGVVKSSLTVLKNIALHTNGTKARLTNGGFYAAYFLKQIRDNTNNLRSATASAEGNYVRTASAKDARTLDITIEINGKRLARALGIRLDPSTTSIRVNA